MTNLTSDDLREIKNVFEGETRGLLDKINDIATNQTVHHRVTDTKLDGVNSRLDGLNGSVARHEKEIKAIDKETAVNTVKIGIYAGVGGFGGGGVIFGIIEVVKSFLQ